MSYQMKIGLEIHAQLKLQTKMFSNVSVNYDSPNTSVSLFDIGIPGCLPILNQESINQSIRAGIGLNCKIQNFVVFDRKHYFYPDLPTGFQITQFYYPLCTDGYVVLNNNKHIGINRIHMETDAGKLIHQDNYSLIDYNRCGISLIEIVTEPHLSSVDEVVDFLHKTIRVLKYTKVCDCDMERGNLRVDVNLSLIDDKNVNTNRVEIKNINSILFVKKAIISEYNRQVKLLQNQQSIVQETRSYNADKGITTSMREKVSYQDYCYIPDHNIPYIILNNQDIQNIKDNLGELPYIREQRYKNYLNNQAIIDTLLNNQFLGNYFDEVIKYTDHKVLCANIITTIVLSLYYKKDQMTKITAENLANLINLYKEHKISIYILKQVVETLYVSSEDPFLYIKNNNLMQDELSHRELEKIAQQVLSENEEAVIKYKNGKIQILQFLIGRFMAQSKGKSNPHVSREIILKYLNK